MCLVLHLETFFVRKEDVGRRWGEEAGVLDCWISALPETAPARSWFNYEQQVVVFYMTYFPDGFPRVSLMPRSLTYWSQEGRAVRPASPEKEEPGGLDGGPQKKGRDETGKRLGMREAGERRESRGRRLLLALGRYSMTSLYKLPGWPKQPLPRRPRPGEDRLKDRLTGGLWANYC